MFDAEGTPGLKEFLKQQWISVWSKTASLTSSPSLCDSWFDRVYAQHNEQGRFYHTAVHLKEMLEYLEILQQSGVVTQDQAVPMVWAIFFHDAVYDPKSSQNEKDSAILFRDFSKEASLDSDLVEVVVTMIGATEKHQIIAMQGQAEMEVAQTFFLDLDMAVLGKKTGAYLAYAGLIRREYYFVEHETYCSKRAEVLQTFLDDSKTIYSSEVFKAAMEAQARDNLMNEIGLLQTGIIPSNEPK
ncbi:MAG: hypothetical protein SGILL_005119 [Bacillariaceae sp.]